MVKAAKFSNNVEISGNIDISGNINLDGTLTIDGSLDLYGYNIPDPAGENNKVLTISGDGYSWETVQSGGSTGDATINSAEQTFYEIITEQPAEFTLVYKSGTSFENTTSTIDISWNFDNIIAVNDSGEQQILNISDDMISRVLPCITRIHFDISSTISDSGSVSDSFYIDIDSGDNYNVDHKSVAGTIVSDRLTYTLNYDGLRLNNSGSDLNTYTINVWGENTSNDADTFNKLTYSDLVFESSGIPETPAITDIDSITSSDLIEFIIDISISDLDSGNPNTELDGSIYITEVDLSYSLITASSELLRSSFYGDGTHASTSVVTDTTYNTNISHSSLDDSGTEEVVGLQVNYTENFYFGAKYDLQVKIKNNLAEQDTSYSDISTSSYTNIPDSDGISINTFSGNRFYLFNENNSTFSTISTISKSGIYLYNLAEISTGNDKARIKPSNVNNRTIEISDQSKTTTSHASGYGKYIDNSTNLVTVTCYLERTGVNGGSDVSLQQLSYDGWVSSSSPYTNVTSIANYSDNNIEPFTNESVSDMYSSDEDKKGFRIKGVFQTKNKGLLIDDLSNAELIEPFEASGNTGYRINHNYLRQDSNSVTNDVNSDYFFIDNFPNYTSPSYATDASNVVVTGITWVMGIPNVSTANFSFSREHTNINSEYKYFQSDGLVAQVNTINANNTTTSVYLSGTKNYLTLGYANLTTGGTYTGSFDCSLSYTGISSSLNSNTMSQLAVSSSVYNLYSSETSEETFAVAHYRDVNSIDNYSSVFESDSTNRIYELSYNTISDLGSNFYNVHTNLDVYDNNDHEKEIQSYTLPFISGIFTIDNSVYPDICGSFEWNETLPTTFTNSVYDNSYAGIDLDGNTGDYKWIVYKIDESDSDEYLTGSTSGVNLSYILVKLFGTSVEDNFYDSLYTEGYTGDALGLLVNIVGQNKYSAGGDWYFGRINHESPGFNSGSKWYTANKVTTTKSLTTLRDATSFTYTGALPGSTDQDTIRAAAGWADNADKVNGHPPIVILTFSTEIDNHYLYFGLRE